MLCLHDHPLLGNKDGRFHRAKLLKLRWAMLGSTTCRVAKPRRTKSPLPWAPTGLVSSTGQRTPCASGLGPCGVKSSSTSAGERWRMICLVEWASWWFSCAFFSIFFRICHSLGSSFSVLTAEWGPRPFVSLGQLWLWQQKKCQSTTNSV